MSQHSLITDRTEFARLCQHWQGCEILYLDTEFERVRTFWPRLALLQVSDGETISLVDPLADIGLEAFAPVIADASITKVMHSASEDLLVLQRALNVPFAGLLDSQIAATLAGLGSGMGYQRIAAELLGLELSKEETRTDWMKRPLSSAQLDYAAADVAHLPALHRLILQRASELGREPWILSDCQRLIDKVTREIEGDPDPMARFRNAWKLPSEAQIRLRRILDWREQRARDRDRPRTWILDNENCIKLAQVHPPELANLRKVVDDGARGLPHAMLNELASKLAEPISDHEREHSVAPDPLSSRQKAQFKELQQAITEQADGLAIPPDVLCARKQAEAWLHTHQWPRELEGWREPLLRPAFERISPD